MPYYMKCAVPPNLAFYYRFLQPSSMDAEIDWFTIDILAIKEKGFSLGDIHLIYLADLGRNRGCSLRNL